MNLTVIHEDNHLLAVVKAAGISSQPDSHGDQSIVELASHYRVTREQKPGRAFIGLVHRLDRSVSGVMILAKTSKAADRLVKQFRTRTVRKEYLAVVERRLGNYQPAPWRQWRGTLVHDDKNNRVVMESDDIGVAEDGKESETWWRPVGTASPGSSLIHLVPVTGRRHQLRVHCSNAGMPIAGDIKYGARRQLGGVIALHAVALAINHPISMARLRFLAPPPPAWRQLGVALSPWPPAWLETEAVPA